MRVLLLVIGALLQLIAADDFYELLGVARDADERSIRKAFKKLAMSMHPDKNKDDPEAHTKFVRINRAYEVLKDADLRKKYDTHGEAGLDNSQQGQQYQSWQFYRDNFGKCMLWASCRMRAFEQASMTTTMRSSH